METRVENQAKQEVFVGPTYFKNSVMETEWYDPKSPSSKQALSVNLLIQILKLNS